MEDGIKYKLAPLSQGRCNCLAWGNAEVEVYPEACCKKKKDTSEIAGWIWMYYAEQLVGSVCDTVQITLDDGEGKCLEVSQHSTYVQKQ